MGAAFVRGEWEDDDRYAMLAERAGSLARRDRRARRRTVRLVELTPDNRARAVGRLATHPSQERFVAPMARSFQHALVPEASTACPWCPGTGPSRRTARSSGFLMIAAGPPPGEIPFLWRLLIDRRHQGRGIGTRAVAAAGRASCAPRANGPLEVSWHGGRGGPEPFYRKLGFVPTGGSSTAEHRRAGLPESSARLGCSPPADRRKPSSSTTGTPSSCALASLEPAFSPATR